MELSVYAAIKRMLDVVVASVLLTFGAPVLAVIALALRLFQGSPVLFKQDRPGRGGSVFTMTKFRTMRSGDMPDEERLTKIGQFLRSTSLDELPSMVNVLRGEMSLVGPRPLLVEYLDLYDERQSTRHDVRPGITGLAQVNGRNLLDWGERLELDAEYVETASIKLDLAILVSTVKKVLVREGVSAEGEATMAKFEGSSE